jgi:hypothetical protein
MLDRQIHLVERFQCEPERLDRALEHRGIGDIEDQARLFHQATGFARFGLAFFG